MFARGLHENTGIVPLFYILCMSKASTSTWPSRSLRFPKPCTQHSVLYSLSNAECPNLTDPANGRLVIITGNSVDYTATYLCNSGFELVGAQTLTCQADVIWSDRPPTCEPIGMKSLLYCRTVIMAVTDICLLDTGSQAMEIMNQASCSDPSIAGALNGLKVHDFHRSCRTQCLDYCKCAFVKTWVIMV